MANPFTAQDMEWFKVALSGLKSATLRNGAKSASPIISEACAVQVKAIDGLLEKIKGVQYGEGKAASRS